MHRKVGIVWWLWRGRVSGFCDILEGDKAGEKVIIAKREAENIDWL